MSSIAAGAPQDRCLAAAAAQGLDVEIITGDAGATPNNAVEADLVLLCGISGDQLPC
ncbi:hypothetical protein [Actinokineospora globicatena]|uniref:hypothetical protein n=1 Tax=Actinokineospora globicatena TaxID=103729 RepID=UPI0020A55A3C|nr:hypothetical protein [Actinokineospora globicatena]GLW81027.1 hypothetical protein Aglo01_55080 [Actinokineospora globicatena]GLW88220.1 hypothetical protein Aglo02_58590 [Actinokineospora globicatena]